jgi:hypothetical protein
LTFKRYHTKLDKFFAIDSSIKGLIFRIYNQPEEIDSQKEQKGKR